MANFRYFHPADNVLTASVVSTGVSANAAYPLANAIDFSYKNLANPAKLTATSGDFIFDLGGTTRIDAVVLWHNFDTGLAYRVQMNATNTWGTPTVDLSATAPTKRTDGRTLKAFHDLTGVSGYSTSGKRYLRISVTGTNSASLGLKIMAFSTIRTTGRNLQWGWNRSGTQTGIRMMTEARVPWAYDLAASPRILEMTVPGTDADFAAIDAWVQACAGFVHPTVIVPDPLVNDAWLGFLTATAGQVTQPSVEVFRLDAPYQYLNVNPLRLMLEEITAGDPEWT